MHANRLKGAIDNFFDKYWGLGFIGIASWFGYLIAKNLMDNTTNWVFIHTQIYMVLVLLVIFHTFGGKLTPLRILLITFLQTLLSLDDYAGVVAQLFFQMPEVSWLSERLVVKDTNVFLSIVFLVLFAVNLIIALIAYFFMNKRFFSYIFNLIALGAIIVTTLLFHYVLIEQEFRHTLNHELDKQAKIFTFPPAERVIACQTMNVYCLQGTAQVAKFLPQLSDNQEVMNASVVKGNYSITNVQTHSQDIYLVSKENDFYVVDTKSATQAFMFSEKWLMFCLTVAHGIWLFFYIWLHLFHRRIAKRKEGRIVHWKTITEKKTISTQGVPTIPVKPLKPTIVKKS